MIISYFKINEQLFCVKIVGAKLQVFICKWLLLCRGSWLAITTILLTIIFVDRLIFILQVIYNGVEKSCTAKSLKPNTEYTITVSWFRTIQGEFILLCVQAQIHFIEWMNEMLWMRGQQTGPLYITVNSLHSGHCMS